MNFNFPKINKIEIIGLNLNERKKIESIINDANFKNIFYLDKQYLKKKINSINIIEHFEIFKNYPSTLKIFIKETKILAQTKKNGFGNGVVFGLASRPAYRRENRPACRPAYRPPAFRSGFYK